MSTKQAQQDEWASKVQATLNGDPSHLIDWFDDLGTGNETYRFLSNFYEGEPFEIEGLSGVKFATGEHAFQAFKATTAEDFAKVAFATAGPVNYGKGRTVQESSPGASKAYGRTIDLRPDWSDVRMDVMAAVLRAKFAPGREEAERLLATGDAYLVEGTWWGDTVWGVDLWDEKRPGRNWLGTLLMARRAELRAGQPKTGEDNFRAAGFGFTTF